MARPERNTKMFYVLTGAVIGAILIQVIVLLKHRATDREQMAERLNQLAL